MASFPVFKIVLFVAWILVPLIGMLLLQLPGWIYADDDRRLPLFWKHIDLIAGLCWAFYFLAMLLSSPHFDFKHQDVRSLGGIAFFMLFFSWVACGSIGGLVLGLFNCAADRSEGQEATIKDIKGEGREVTFRIEVPFPAAFTCGQGKMNRGYGAGRRFFVHPGRLGAVWGEFR
jgi:hypothetical protein